jgi:hypothetical protein
MKTPSSVSVLKRVIVMSVGIVYGLGLVLTNPYRLWFLGAGTLLVGILLTCGGLFFDSPLAQAIGLRNPRFVRSRRFYITMGLLMSVGTVGTLLVYALFFS